MPRTRVGSHQTTLSSGWLDSQCLIWFHYPTLPQVVLPGASGVDIFLTEESLVVWIFNTHKEHTFGDPPITLLREGGTFGKQRPEEESHITGDMPLMEIYKHLSLSPCFHS